MSTALAQTVIVKKKEPELAAISSELKPQFGVVRFHRDETLEDRFIVHGLPLSAFTLMPHFFQIQSPRFDLSKGFVIENSSNGLPTMYVASSADGAKVYKLYGFSNAEEEFNRLVADSPPEKIRGIGDAEMRGLLCGEIVYGLSSRWWVADPSNAEMQAAKHFFAEGHKDGLSRGANWWKSVKGDRSAISIHTTRDENGGFSVNLPIFWAPVEGEVAPQIRIYRIDVSESGMCHMGSQPISVLR